MNLRSFTLTGFGLLCAAGMARADIQVFTNAAQFQAVTGATAQPPLPQLGLVGRYVASTTVGDLTFSINHGSPEIALILDEFTVLNPGNEIALSDWEALDVTSNAPVFALGSYFIEGTSSAFCTSNCPCADATYQARLFMNASLVGEVQFNAPDDVLSFVGFASTQPFNRVEYRDLSQQCDNEYWGQFFISSQPACMIITQHPQNALKCPEGTAPFSVGADGPGTLTYQWQMETTPGTWITLGNDPAPLACGGNSSFALAQPPHASSTHIRTHGCTGPFNIRAVVTSSCGSLTSQIAVLTICPADFNCDNALDFFDYLDFVDAFASGGFSADFNLDSVIDFFDYLDFVDAFAGGC